MRCHAWQGEERRAHHVTACGAFALVATRRATPSACESGLLREVSEALVELVWRHAFAAPAVLQALWHLLVQLDRSALQPRMAASVLVDTAYQVESLAKLHYSVCLSGCTIVASTECCCRGASHPGTRVLDVCVCEQIMCACPALSWSHVAASVGACLAAAAGSTAACETSVLDGCGGGVGGGVCADGFDNDAAMEQPASSGGRKHGIVAEHTAATWLVKGEWCFIGLYAAV
jgi:hypothetical protein